jgi:[protein-PII] uridylyltransferase
VSATPTPSESLIEVRAGLLSRPGLVGAELRTALTEAYDAWLRDLFPPRDGVALVAVGGLGRGEQAPFSDLDLVLLHDGKVDGLSALADSIWYPIWDSKVGLDHSVRTADQAVAIAKTDLKAMLGLLDVRHVVGDAGLTARVRERIIEVWRADAEKRIGELAELSQERWAAAGEGAFLLGPNLKDSRGCLRDGQTLHALAVAQLVDYPTAVREVYPVLLDVRGELHRRTGHGQDVLHPQEHDGVASDLGMLCADGTPDRDLMLRRVHEAARTISHALDAALRRVDAMTATRPSRWRIFGSAPSPGSRTGLAKDVVAQDGEVVLARDADPWSDPALLLRAARAAADHEMPLSPFALERFATESAPMPEPWPPAVRDEFVALLGTGHAAVPVLESLDLAGLVSRLIPEWDAVRFKAQYNPVHRFTVDRHLLETAAQASRHTREVARPDLLLVGALLHDIGKGYPPGDHSVVGARVAATIARRMGFSPEDVATITALARHHLLLPDTATRRDLDDPMTITTVADAVGGSGELMDLLHALTIADAAATGPAAWSDWKAGLITDLVHRTRAVLLGDQPPQLTPLDEQRRELAEARELAVVIRGDEVVVAAPDCVGVLYRTAGVLALHSLDVRAASIRTHAGMAVNAFVVEPRFGRLPDPAVVRTDLAHALDGELSLADRLRDKERAYAPHHDGERLPPTVLWFDDAATDATVVEFRGDDSIGLLCRVTAALERCGLDVRSARVSSLGGSVVDAFYVTTRDGQLVPVPERAAVEQELRSV